MQTETTEDLRDITDAIIDSTPEAETHPNIPMAPKRELNRAERRKHYKLRATKSLKKVRNKLFMGMIEVTNHKKMGIPANMYYMIAKHGQNPYQVLNKLTETIDKVESEPITSEVIEAEVV